LSRRTELRSTVILSEAKSEHGSIGSLKSVGASILDSLIKLILSHAPSDKRVRRAVVAVDPSASLSDPRGSYAGAGRTSETE